MKQEKIPVLVARKIRETDNICSFYLVAQAGNPLPIFTAGSHIDVFIDSNTIRQYSLCNNPSERHQYQIAVLRENASRGGSEKMYDVIKEGDILEISAPRNYFPLCSGNHSNVLLAGGIGVTPILCMAESLSNSGINFEFHYFVRSQKNAAFVERIKQSTFASQTFFNFHDNLEAVVIDLEKLLHRQPSGTHFYVCGPGRFIEEALAAAAKFEWDSECLHREFFKVQPVTTSESDEASKIFFIKIASSGEEYLVPSNKSITDVLTAHGIEIPMSCEQGVFWTCLTRILKGQPDHRDAFLTEEEHAKNDQFTPCCSRAKSDVLVLDL